MKNSNVRNLILIIGGLYFVAFLFSLSFTFIVNKEQKNAVEYAEDNYTYTEDGVDENKTQAELEQYYLDSVANEPVYTPWLFFGKKSWTLSECQESELKLGLDLQGGMNVTLEISMRDILIALSGESKDPVFNQALQIASQKETNSQDNYLDLFLDAFEELNKNAPTITRLSSPQIFGNKDLREKIPADASNREVMAVIKAEAEGAIDRAFIVLRARIDKFGVAQPTIQKITGSSRIVVELPGAKDVDRVKKLLQSAAVLEFWETYDNIDLFSFLNEANFILTETYGSDDNLDVVEDEKIDDVEDLDDLDDLLLDETENDIPNTINTLFDVLAPQAFQDQNGQLQLIPGPVVGSSLLKDTAKVNQYLMSDALLDVVPNEFRNIKFLWSVKPILDANEEERLQLIAIKSNREDKARLAGDVIEDANQDIDQYGNPEINMRMNRTGAREWQKVTAENIGKSVAVVLDDIVYSFPVVNAEISGGSSVISGDFTLEEAQDLANVLKAGKLPAPAKIIQSDVVGPSLGAEAIDSGYKSFLIALGFILLYMIFYYMHAGVASNVALLVNMFFIFGALSGLGGVLTLPGIAGIVLTIGMSVDANVLIYERIREELAQGKGVTLAIRDGYSQAYSSIIDANITTLLTGIVLFYFGSGPIKGFATTLIIGILTSLFCAIFITRLIFEARLKSKKTINFSNFLTHNAFKNLKIKFLNKRVRYYIFSFVIITIGLVSLFTKNLNYGIDFQGGRTYIVRCEEPVVTNDLRNTLGNFFVTETNLNMYPEVKTFGENNQVKITTNYLMEIDSEYIDSLSNLINELESQERPSQETVEQARSLGIDVNDVDSPDLMNLQKAGVINDPAVQAAILKDEKDAAIKRFTDEADDTVQEKLHAGLVAYGVENYEIMSSQMVGKTISDDIQQSAFLSILLSLLLIFIYILIRFKKWQYSLGAVIAVFHDVLILLSVFSIFYGILPFSLEIDQAFIAAVLTVIGYSLNDTVVVFDRIREYIAIKPGERIDVINGALNSTLSRTINTSLTTFFVLLVIFIFGGEIVRGFMFAIMVGVIVGTYSSLFIASPIMYDTTLSIKRTDVRSYSGYKKNN